MIMINFIFILRPNKSYSEKWIAIIKIFLPFKFVDATRPTLTTSNLLLFSEVWTMSSRNFDSFPPSRL